MITGLFRFLLALAAFLFVRRVWRGIVAQREAARRPPETPRRPQPEADLGRGQKIEEADYEELD